MRTHPMTRSRLEHARAPFEASAGKLRKFAFRAMAGDNELQFYWPERRDAEGIAGTIIAEVRRIESKYSRYREDSVITRINRAACGAPVPPATTMNCFRSSIRARDTG